MNLTTAINRGSLMSHQMTMRKMNITNTEMGQGNFKAVTRERIKYEGYGNNMLRIYII